MKILKIEKYKGSTLRLELEDGREHFISSETASAMNLLSGTDIPESALEDLLLADKKRKARERALYLLDGRDYSYVELYEKLECSYGGEVAYQVVDELSEKGLINDRRYAEEIARRLYDSKGYGFYRVREELRRRGIPEAVISETLEKYSDQTEIKNRILKAIRSRYPGYLSGEKAEPEDRHKLKAALGRLGFCFSDIDSALRDIDSGELGCDEEEE